MDYNINKLCKYTPVMFKIHTVDIGAEFARREFSIPILCWKLILFAITLIIVIDILHALNNKNFYTQAYIFTIHEVFLGISRRLVT